MTIEKIYDSVPARATCDLCGTTIQYDQNKSYLPNGWQNIQLPLAYIPDYHLGMPTRFDACPHCIELVLEPFEDKIGPYRIVKGTS